MSSDWPTVRLGDHVDACLGKMLDAKKNKGTPQPYLGNSNVRWGKFDLNDLAEMRFEPHEEERYSLKPGDLVVCEGGEPGRCAIWTGPAGMKVQKALHRIRPKDTLDNYYLFYWFQLSAKAGLLEPHFTGTTIKHLTGKAIAALEVPLPSIEVQRAMVDVLKQLDDRITLLRETNSTLEAIAQALFKSWFVDFDPVHAKMQGRAPEGMDEATAALFPDSFEDSELGPVPKGWCIGTLDKLAHLNPESWSAKNHPERILYVDLANTKAGQIDDIAEFSFVDAPSRARRVLREGDAIVGTVRPGNRSFARIATNEPGLTGSTGFAVLRAKEEFDQALIYIAATCDEAIDRLAHLADGGAYPAVRPEAVGGTPLVIPPAVVRKAFGDMGSSLFQTIGSNQERCRLLAQLRDTLLPRLISGQLNIENGEACKS